MADTYKYLGESGLEELINQTKTYDAASLAVAKKYADDQIAANKITVDTALSDASTNPTQNKVVKAEFDEVRSEIDAIESSLTSGTVVVKKAEHAESATTATTATKATQDGNGNVISDTYETISNATSKYDEFAEDIKTLNEAIDLKANITNYNESIIGLSVNGTTVTYVKGDGSTHTFETQDTDTTYSLGTDEVTGLTKLYATTGSAEDGTMTQKAIKTELDKKVGVTIDESQDTLVFTI